MTAAGRQRNLPEAVALFDHAEDLYAAIDALMTHGVDRADIGVLAEAEAVDRKLGDRFWRAEDLADEPDAPRKAYVSEEGVGAIEGALIATPAYVAAVAVAGALVTPGGSMLTAIGAAALAGGAGAAFGGFLAWMFGRRHAEHLEAQLRHGGLLLWVRAWDEAHQARIVAILKDNGGRDVHVHGWTVAE